MAILLNSQAQGVSGKNEQSTQTPWRGAKCGCIGCIGLRPALLVYKQIVRVPVCFPAMLSSYFVWGIFSVFESLVVGIVQVDHLVIFFVAAACISSRS